ncbi:alpha-galactosidase [Enterococcus faecium]|uniref:alpha-galactosidase n=1 Tax=Enterococcus faecium TaxID=1352 RepID=UPI0023B2A191|nr:alpha-galactosidase [Enterococcus faecium]
MIEFNQVTQQFHLFSQNDQLTLGILPSGHLAFYYFGEKLGNVDLSYVVTEIQRASYLADTDCIKDFKLEQLPLAYPTFGNPDLRTPAFQVELADGSRLSDLRYHKHRICTKRKISGLPTTLHEKAQSLMITLFDQVAQIKVTLIISIFPDHDVFTQHVRIENHSVEAVQIERCMSVNLDFLSDKYDLLTLGGAWGRESHLNRRKVSQGSQGVDSKRGASGHGQNPFIALLAHDCQENNGKLFGLNLVYSGNFLASAEVDMHQNTRLQIGINPFEFSWELVPGDHFETPEVVMVHSSGGLNELSLRYRRFYQECLLPNKFAKKERPILMNNWEATYFNFNREKILSLARIGKELGMELFVLDDGWFGERNSDNSSLGDWIPNEEKLGGHLKELIQDIQQLGLDFGLWIEPEMVSPKSDLYQRHPDWIIRVPQREPQQVRHQYVLDLSRLEVQDYLIEVITNLLTENQISYLKWDMNRNITDAGSFFLSKNHQKELGHRYILGLYRILAVITNRFPELLLETCAGGGGRFDPGMLAYSAQIWTSDDTDAIERLAVQEGTSLIYPQAAMSCHVSAVPNHQVGRITSLQTRGIVAQHGSFGYELDLLALSEAEKEEISNQISEYKIYRQTMQLGKLLRLAVYDSTNEHGWQQEDEEYLILNHVFILVKANTVPKRLKALDLEKNARYQLVGSQRCFTGAELMSVGLSIPKPVTDFASTRWILKKVQ